MQREACAGRRKRERTQISAGDRETRNTGHWCLSRVSSTCVFFFAHFTSLSAFFINCLSELSCPNPTNITCPGRSHQSLRSISSMSAPIPPPPSPSGTNPIKHFCSLGPGWVDVFYLFFYSYNRGNYFNGNRFGDHVGDWENTMIRFKNGKPMYVAPEAHGGRVMLGDSAFNYNVLEHLNGRPVVYAANGTHGMYPQPGQQNYTGLPVAIYDVTDKGHLWDPTLNYKSFFFSNEHGFSYTADTPLKLQSRQRLGWLRFLGYWGDQKPELSNPHQTCIGTMCFYEGGPLGPQSKSLSRGWICGSSDCQPQSTLPTMFRPGGQRANSPYSSSWTNRLNFLSGVLLILLTAYAIHLT
ncbi:Vacuolar protein sorting-associated protein 62, variant 2 [Puccinia graminis f. sp. tritici]|uniref:Vacuolar protein sorting-associated protein 62, variant 2 n=1 Tax=Puccinia graminis f. sp. tritici TaxID=56615 RepID=A0A5B0LXE8_PUCGR|nr:Vacuolar protein sorting-associated protein 62, variant 2 [Puccinia graminis f. sp. tritici]KAA1104572.1 Vacuolar protein sorting-associated protein 62, variant 2 [Puccinia graminis f. sp. tritici]